MVTYRVKSLVELAPEVVKSLSGSKQLFLLASRDEEGFEVTMFEREASVIGSVSVMPVRIRLELLPSSSATVEGVRELLQEVERASALAGETDDPPAIAGEALKLLDIVEQLYPKPDYGHAVTVATGTDADERGIGITFTYFEDGDRARPFKDWLLKLSGEIERLWSGGAAAWVEVTLREGLRQASAEFREHEPGIISVQVDQFEPPFGLKLILPPPSVEQARQLLEELLKVALRAALVQPWWGDFDEGLVAQAHIAKRLYELLKRLYPGASLEVETGGSEAVFVRIRGSLPGWEPKLPSPEEQQEAPA